MRKKLLLLCIGLPLLAGCIESTSLQNAGQFQESLRAASIDQINRHLAKAVDDPFAVPMFANFSTADVTTGGSFSISPSWSDAAHSITRGVDGKIGDFSSSSKLTIAPENSTTGMLITRDLFAYELAGAPMSPAELQLLLFAPPPPKWLHHASPGKYPTDCLQKCFLIGTFGKYTLFTDNHKSYSDFLILVSDTILIRQDRTTAAGTAKPAKATAAAHRVPRPFQRPPTASNTPTKLPASTYQYVVPPGLTNTFAPKGIVTNTGKAQTLQSPTIRVDQ